MYPFKTKYIVGHTLSCMKIYMEKKEAFAIFL